MKTLAAVLLAIMICTPVFGQSVSSMHPELTFVKAQWFAQNCRVSKDVRSMCAIYLRGYVDAMNVYPMDIAHFDKISPQTQVCVSGSLSYGDLLDMLLAYIDNGKPYVKSGNLDLVTFHFLKERFPCTGAKRIIPEQSK